MLHGRLEHSFLFTVNSDSLSGTLAPEGAWHLLFDSYALRNRVVGILAMSLFLALQV